MSEVMQRDQQEVEEIAKALGLICFLPQPNELFLDIDKGTALNERVKSVLADNGLQVKDSLITISKGGNKHIYIRLNQDLRGNMVRIALQAMLGSDAVKEALSTLRIMNDSDAPVALFETKLQAKLVEKWRAKGSRSTAICTSSISLLDDDIPY